MARLITLKNDTVTAFIAPENGGMVASLQILGTEVLRMDWKKLELIPMLSGGIPILFPFVSKTMGDEYTVNGKTYGMPALGIVKNAPFGIVNVSDTEVTLTISNNDGWLQSVYPYPFQFSATYRLTEDGILLLADVTNTGKETLYHAFGWHPFFLATDKKAVRLTHPFQTDYDYIRHVDRGPAPRDMDLSKLWDHVFHEGEGNSFTIDNPVDGYIAKVIPDASFPAFVICTSEENAVVAEPWTGLPNAANSHRYGDTVQVGETKRYAVRICLEKRTK